MFEDWLARVFDLRQYAKTWFKCLQSLVLSDCKDVDLLQGFLVLKQKCEVTKGRPVQASFKHAQSCCTFALVYGLCFLPKKGCNAQEKQIDIKPTLPKWQCYLFAIFRLIQCVIFH